MISYTQVKLQHMTEDKSYIAWIPTRHAKINKILLFDDDPTRWKVVEKYETQAEDKVLSKAQDFKKQRKASDI